MVNIVVPVVCQPVTAHPLRPFQLLFPVSLLSSENNQPVILN